MPEPAGNRPALLFYCQHSLGIGHLVRALALCEALTARYQVVLVSGGVFPTGLSPPSGVNLVSLPAVRAGSDFTLMSHDPSVDVEEVMEQRRRLLLDWFRGVQPAVVVVELYPFGRKKFGSEIRPLLDQARFYARPVVVCSVRDLVVSKNGSDGFRHEAVNVANDYFDAILVHTDPRVVPVPEFEADGLRLITPVLSTGFVTQPRRPQSRFPVKRRRVVVSAGGGMAGELLLRCALEAQPRIWAQAGLAMRLIAGPLVPPGLWIELEQAAASLPGLELLKFVPELLAELETAQVSVSQCGYNTALDVIRARVRSVVVPVEAEGDEQLTRARRLEELGLVRLLTPDDLSPEMLADAVCESVSSADPPFVDIDFGGAAATADLIAELERQHARRDRRPATGDWLAPLRTALDEAPEAVTFFFRDDDVGWGDDRLRQVLELFRAYTVPVDLAVIPQALCTRLAEELVELAQAPDANMAFLQHGFAHLNHQPEGKKAEFGSARSYLEQLADIDAGRKRLLSLLDTGFRQIFVPPWNRCTATTLACLVELGFPAVSRECRAQPPPPATLIAADVSIELFRKRKGIPLTLAQLGRELAAAAATSDKVGLLIHHERIHQEEIAALDELLATLAKHQRVRCAPMASFLQPVAAAESPQAVDA